MQYNPKGTKVSYKGYDIPKLLTGCDEELDSSDRGPVRTPEAGAPIIWTREGINNIGAKILHQPISPQFGILFNYLR